MNLNNKEKNTYVRKQILKTLLKMMKTQDFHSIVISDLVNKAEVGRASFYRNYESKEDVLIQEAERLINLWSQEYDKLDHTKISFSTSLLDFMKKHSNFYLSLHKANLSYIILNTILKNFEITEDTPNGLAYLKSSIAYMTYGWIIEWMNRGMQESGTELDEMFKAINKNELV